MLVSGRVNVFENNGFCKGSRKKVLIKLILLGEYQSKLWYYRVLCHHLPKGQDGSDDFPFYFGGHVQVVSTITFSQTTLLYLYL